MRRVAQALDTGPASLYVYVANTAELHAAVLDELLAGLPEDGTGPWRTRLDVLLRGYADLLFTYPRLARSALVLRPVGGNALRLYDRVLGLLLEGGVPADRAAWGVDLLLLYVTSNAAEHSAPAPGDIDASADENAKTSALEHALRSADAEATPHVALHVDQLLGGTPAERVAWTLQVLITGIAATPTTVAGDS